MIIDTELKTNLKAIYSQITENERISNINWYREAFELCNLWAATYHIPLYKIVGVMSAYSINNSWIQNVQWTRHFLDGQPIGMNIHIEKANRIMQADSYNDVQNVLGGFKLQSFYLNILQPENQSNIRYKWGKTEQSKADIKGAVTIDRHAARAAYNCMKIKSSQYKGKNYVTLANAYNAVAEEVGLLPQELQALIWCKWLKINE